MARFQFWIGMVHFLLAFWTSMSNSFNKLSLFGLVMTSPNNPVSVNGEIQVQDFKKNLTLPHLPI